MKNFISEEKYDRTRAMSETALTLSVSFL